MRSLAELPFDAREERAIDTTARWMGTLGRFQILSGGLLLLLCVSVGVAWTFSAVTAAEVETDTTPPLVTLGEVSNTQMGIAMSLVALFAIIILRGGVHVVSPKSDNSPLVNVDEMDPWLRLFYGDLQAMLRDGMKVVVHAEEVSDRLIGLMGGYIRWSGLIDDPSQAIMLTERIGARQLDPASRELIMRVHELRS